MTIRLLMAALLLIGCGTSLCDQSRDPDGTFCGGERLSLGEAIDRARGRQPELADATLVRVTSGATGSMNVDGRDTMWQLIFVVADGSDRTLTVTPGRTEVRPGGASGSTCDGAGSDALPPSPAATQNAVLHFERDHGLVRLGGAHGFVYFYEHDCYDPSTARTSHVELTETTDVGANHWFYVVDTEGELTSVCGPCEAGGIELCEPCAAP